MLSQAEMRKRFADGYNFPPLLIRLAATHFVSPDGIGRLRIREYPLYASAFDLDRLASELEQIFAVVP